MPKRTREELKNRRARMAKAVKEGSDAYTVAKTFGVRPPAVYNACRENGVDIRKLAHTKQLGQVPYTTERNAKIVEDARKGMSAHELGDKYNISANRARQIVKAGGGRIKGRSTIKDDATPQLVYDSLKLMMEGSTPAKVAAELGMHKGRAKGIQKKAKLAGLV